MFKCCQSDKAVAEPAPHAEKDAIVDDAPTEADEVKTDEEAKELEPIAPVEEEPIVDEKAEEPEAEDKTVADDDKTEAEQTEAAAEDEAMKNGYNCCGVLTN
jgi:hypothetical protein